MIGNTLKFITTNPLGEELAEGTIGGLLYGSGGLGTEQPIEETLAKTAGAIGGGIALGIGGRRIGAFAGKRLNPNALRDQDGILSSIARVSGSETTAKGLTGQASIMKGAVERSLVEDTSSSMLREAVKDPQLFAEKYGVSAEVFQNNITKVQQGRMVQQALELAKELPQEKRSGILQAALGDYAKVEDALMKEASGSINQSLGRVHEKISKGFSNEEVAQQLKASGLEESELKKALSDLMENKAETVTGEHVGRAIGRFAGDEIGILTGAALAGTAYDAMNE
jgi:tetrahydromethanopterin S-methyltransferase subunit G